MTSERVYIDIETLRATLGDRGAAVLVYDRSGRLVEERQQSDLERLAPKRLSDMLARSQLLHTRVDKQIWFCEIEIGRAAYLIVDHNRTSPRPSVLIIASGPGSDNRILNSIPIGILNLDANFQLVHANNRAELYLGASDSDLHGSGWQKFFAPENLEGLITHFRTPATASHPYRQTMILTQDGQLPRHFDISAVAQWRGSKGTASYCVSLIDMGREHRIREELVRATAEDALTHLMNRRKFLDTLNALPVSELSNLGIAYVDVDDFGMINDRLGHKAGDELLRIVAMRLRSAVRDTDFIARVGGDEMIVACRDVSTEEKLAAFGRKLETLLNDTISIKGNVAQLNTSIGLAHGTRCISDNGGEERLSFSECLIKKADAAMYQAKAEGKGRCCIYSDALNDRIATLEAKQWEFKQIVDTDALTCVFQPIRGKHGPIALEALTRPTMKLEAHRSIEDLIETAKRGKRPHEFLDQLAQRAIATYGAYLQTPAGRGRPDLDKITLNLNIDVVQLLQGDFISRLLGWCEEARLEPAQICLEITETALENDAVELMPVLQGLRRFGFRLSMDDFGTGYSSLKRLLLYEFDQIKIDRFFINSAQASAKYLGLLAAMVTMGKSASIEMLAEGVENQEEEALCLRAGVELLQGYHLGRPAPINEVFGETEAPEALQDAGDRAEPAA